MSTELMRLEDGGNGSAIVSYTPPEPKQHKPLIHEARVLRVLEPLCEATGDLLEPIQCYQSDRLSIELDEDGRHFHVRLFTVNRDGTESTFAPSGNAMQLIRRIPECFKHEDRRANHWTCGGTDTTALVIYHAWPQDKIVFLSDEAKLTYEYLLYRFLMQSRNSSLIANFKVEQANPLMPPDFVDHPDLPLAPHQKVGVICALNTEAFGGFMEQGTGKTPMSVALTCLLAKRKFRETPKQALRVLIVCPRQVRTNWVTEYRRFATVPGKTIIMRGKPVKRTKALVAALRPEKDCIFSCVLSSYESVEKTWEAISMIPWDLVILDESHKIKNPQTARFKVCRKLRDLSARRLILTGTPIGNSIMDLWTQFEFLGDGLSGFTTFEAFKKFYGEWEKLEGCHGVEKLVAVKNLPLIQERLARLALMVTKKEAGLNLPEIVEDVVDVTLTKKQLEIYCRLRDQLAVEIEEMWESDDQPTARSLTAENVLTRLLRLSQITSGFVKYDDTYDLDTGKLLKYGACENIEDINTLPKIKQMLDMIQDPDRDPLAKTIVWECWGQDRRNIVHALTMAGINFRVFYGSDKVREQSVSDFNNDPTCKVIVCSAKMAGEGLNLVGYDWDNAAGPQLTTYADLAIFFSENWSIFERGQAISRCHRRGTRRNVRIATLVAPGTIDQEIYERLIFKHDMSNLIQDVRNILKRICESDPSEAMDD